MALTNTEMLLKLIGDELEVLNENITTGGGGGGVTSVTAASPLVSSGGATPEISFDNTTPDGTYALDFVGGVLTFVPIQGETVGSYKAFAHTNIPSNYLWCNGAVVLIANYPDLFAEIGITYGGDGVSTFGLPDLQGRLLKGDSGADIGTSSGSNTLSVGNLPQHSHGLFVNSDIANTDSAAGNYLSSTESGNGAGILSTTPTNLEQANASSIGLSGSGLPHEHPHVVVRWAICFESVGVNGASPTPSFNATLGIDNDSNIRALFNGIPYVALNEIPNFLDETSTIADFVTGNTYYYIGEATITYDYDLLPYPLPVPASNFSFVNLSVYDVIFTSDFGNYNYTLKPLQALKDITVIDGGLCQVLATEYIDNIYTLQQVVSKGNTTRDAFFVINNPDTYRTRYSTIGTQIQRSDLGFELRYGDVAIELLRSTGNKSWELQIPDIAGNANNSSFTVAFRPNVSGTVAYLSDVVSGAVTEQTHTTGATVTIADSITILYVNPATLLATLAITLPASPVNGQEVKVSFGGTITSGEVVTALTVVGNVGHTVLGIAPTPAFAGDGYVFKFQSSLNLWRIF